jgi:DAK2 domain fusion protein YloV
MKHNEGLRMDQLGGNELKQAFSDATGCLEEYRDAINALNVFPVPDGDTGTNMLLTMRAALQSADDCPEDHNISVGSVASALAKGAFFGARGNSGVILSQIMKGFSDALDGKEYLTAEDLCRAFNMASAGAYSSVGNPVEGTMLSVIRGASEAIQDSEDDVDGLWSAAYQAAQNALEKTPEQLPVLKEAGVVDAGGLGVVVLLGGILQSVSNIGTSAATIPVDLSELSRFHGTINRGVNSSFLNATVEQEWGFCTQFIISRENGQNLDLNQILSHFQQTALSTVVVGDEQNVRVHIHVEDTAPALIYAESLGSVSEIKTDDMDSQNAEFASSGHVRPAVGVKLALLPVAQGDGLSRLFLDSGCAGVVEGGQTMNPSVQQILDAARATGAVDVIVLPNNGNVVLAAEQAATSDSSIHVVPTKSIPQGVTALLAFNPEGPWQENIQAMTAALSEVTSIEVAAAVRGASIGGVSVAEGQYIGLLEGQLVIAEDMPEKALKSALHLAGLSTDAIVSIYFGSGRTLTDAQFVATELESEYPGIQVDLIEGGQSHHAYLASIE